MFGSGVHAVKPAWGSDARQLRVSNLGPNQSLFLYPPIRSRVANLLAASGQGLAGIRLLPLERAMAG